MSVDLLTEVEAFLVESGLGEHRFGILAVKNGRLVERLRNNRRIWPDTEMKVRAFIRSRRDSQKSTRNLSRGVAA
ncbi:MAG: hypothetical protein Q8R92_01075 [Deltaproteobacteria bacterium]|nr:hypothetical protein [Deltaproteobacteria bacterium]